MYQLAFVFKEITGFAEWLDNAFYLQPHLLLMMLQYSVMSGACVWCTQFLLSVRSLNYLFTIRSNFRNDNDVFTLVLSVPQLHTLFELLFERFCITPSLMSLM